MTSHDLRELLRTWAARRIALLAVLFRVFEARAAQLDADAAAGKGLPVPPPRASLLRVSRRPSSSFRSPIAGFQTVSAGKNREARVSCKYCVHRRVPAVAQATHRRV